MSHQSTTTIDGLTTDVYLPADERFGNLTLVHGAWVGGWIWESFAHYLADHGWRCHALTLRGRYESKPVDNIGKISFEEFVEDALTVYRATNSEVMIGESMGGLIAMKAAEQLPDLKALVLMNPAPPFMVPVRWGVLKNQIRYLPDLLFGRPNKPDEADYKALILNNVPEPEASDFYRQICPESGAVLSQLSMGKVKVDATKIRCPVYLVVGHKDSLIPVKAHHKTAQLLNAEVADYPSMSHHTFSEQGWEKVADDVLGWLESKTQRATT